MRPIDLHPEELFDRRHCLGRVDADRYQAHLEICAPCRLERLAAEDFKAEDAVASLDAMVDAVIGQLDGAVVAKPARKRQAMPLLAAAAAMLVALGGVTAWALLSNVPIPASESDPEPEPESEPASVSVPEPASEPVPAPASVPASVPEPVPAPPSAARVRAAHEQHPRPVLPPSASDLFAQATHARRARNHAQALSLYAALEQEHPGSREALNAQVLMGSLLAERLGRPRDALRSFDAYLRASPRGTLAEEARVGRARALERLDERALERAAWVEVLREHPGSAHADYARKRIELLR